MSKLKFPEAEARLFTHIFICQACGARIRADPVKVKAKKIKCRKCRKKQLRAIKKERKTV
ncbi:MAG: 50S ribosomal protein L40e [Candidatus Aenigmarchaeota archaeon]|nr:50S ribosomal protein L40e [Candidatus Aenigmarchaeota archaeon]